jgi:hypothetical protein
MAIRNYLDGALPLSSRLLVEEHIKKCKLCAEAMEGFKKHGRRSYMQSDFEFMTRRIRRTYAREYNQSGRRLPALILFSLAVFLLILLAVFYIFRQNMADRQAPLQTLPDSALQTTKSAPDTAQKILLRTNGDTLIKP